MKEQDFGTISRRAKDIRPSAIEGIGGAIEQDLGYDVKPGQLPDGKGGYTLF